jgi:hypothetical protein
LEIEDSASSGSGLYENELDFYSFECEFSVSCIRHEAPIYRCHPYSSGPKT